MNTKELIEDSYIKNWLSCINAKKTTREGYTYSLRATSGF